jgi:hypothetical protein
MRIASIEAPDIGANHDFHERQINFNRLFYTFKTLFFLFGVVALAKSSNALQKANRVCLNTTVGDNGGLRV